MVVLYPTLLNIIAYATDPIILSQVRLPWRPVFPPAFKPTSRSRQGVRRWLTLVSWVLDIQRVQNEDS
ncbi:hypothetical protein QWZ16_07575 [Vibrio ostreicida]|uniref:Uncharacterized protein n=1 Tax=Vibrio ostreicida TaxID=526588 RepID=A0ABT8BTQ4_9VIBR|nr:hypothetical protein [Vibrio ostreicida]MDN3609560.1 hypothetical protein [Vibrio ostreicida]